MKNMNDWECALVYERARLEIEECDRQLQAWNGRRELANFVMASVARIDETEGAPPAGPA